jgi:diguanylate cyclase (GGDEF)-like protein/PAS domain S-box-containing protein
MSDLAPESTGDAATRAAVRAALDRLGEAELMAMAHSAPVGLFAATADAGLVLVNARFVEIVGRPVSEILGRSYLDTILPDDLERVQAARADALQEGVPEVDLEYRVRRPDGDVRWVRARAVRVGGTGPTASYVGSMVDVTEFKQIEDALRESEARFRAIVEQGFDIVNVLDNDGRVLYTSPAAQRVGGYRGSGSGRLASDFIHPDDAERVMEYYANIAGTETIGAPITFRLITASGDIEMLEAIARDLSGDPAVGGIVVVGRVITDRVETEAQLRASEARLRDQASILEMIATSTPRADTLAEMCRMVESQVPGTRCTVLLVDEEHQTLVHGAAPSFPSSFLHELDGLPIAAGSGACGTAAFLGETVIVPDVLTDPSCAAYRAVAREHDLRGCWSVPVHAASDGRVLGTFACYVSEVRGPTPTEEGVLDSVAQLAAIAIERTQFEDRLAHQAHHDPLTRLPNRILFGELLEHSLRRAQRSGAAVAVLFFDLDRFKVVNDSLGHDAGDELLDALGARLSGVLRPGDVVARFGGDEFTVLCDDLEPGVADRQAIGVAERLLDALRDPFVIGNEEQFVSASVGIAISTTGLERPEALLRDADAAMYRAKERGKGRCEVFDEQMRERARHRHETENALHRAVARDEFCVFYQPIVSLTQGTCVGVEALARWQHPDRGLLSPGEFLATAEETGLVVPIGAWVLQEACTRAVEWRRAMTDPDGFRLSINLSGRQLVHADLAELVADVLRRAELRPDALCVEITETVLMEDIEAGVSAVKALKASACASASTTSGPATPRWATCGSSRSTT